MLDAEGKVIKKKIGAIKKGAIRKVCHKTMYILSVLFCLFVFSMWYGAFIIN